MNEFFFSMTKIVLSVAGYSMIVFGLVVLTYLRISTRTAQKEDVPLLEGTTIVVKEHQATKKLSHVL